MPSTHFEKSVGWVRVIVDEPALSRCDMHAWPIAAGVLASLALVALSIKPNRWHFLAGGVSALVGPAAAAAARMLVPRPYGDDGSLFAVVPEIQFPAEPIILTTGLAMGTIAVAVTALVAKKDLRLRIAASVLLPLAITCVVRSVMCARAFRVAIADLASVGEVPTIDATNWPKAVHPGQAFTVKNVVTPAVPHPGLFGFIGGRTIDATQWKTLQSFTAREPGTTKVTLFAERGPVRVEREKDLYVFRDEGPSWMPLALGNTWTLTKARGKPEKHGAVDAAFTKDAPDPKGTRKILRVDREIFGDGLHQFVITFTDERGAVSEATVYRRDGALIDVTSGDEYTAGNFPLLGPCRYAIAPIDDARTLAGPTICGFTTVHEPYGSPGVVDTILAVVSLGAIDSRPTHAIEEGFILVRSRQER